MLSWFFENCVKNKGEILKFLEDFLVSMLPNKNNLDLEEYKKKGIEYLFYNNDEFLYILKYQIFKEINGDYLEKVFEIFQLKHRQWIDSILNNCNDKDKIIEVLKYLGKKKLEILKIIVLPSFRSLENDVKNSEIVTNMLNSIVEHLQKMQKNQNMMLANISHEMRTPLNSVIGYLDILDSITTLSPEERKNIIYAKNSSKLLLTLINDLLDTQKLSNATLDLITQPFWVNKVIKNAVLISSVNATQKNIEFNYIDKTDLLYEVMGDENRFLQILNNLFSNAVKFTPKGGKIEIVATNKDLGDKVEVNIKVKDNGIGIPKDKQTELFKPFVRATNKEKGTGLGLYISKQLANRMGGDIWFESEEKKGSVFYVKVTFDKSQNFYNKDILKKKNIVILKEKSLDYCKNIQKQLKDIGANITIFSDVEGFMKYTIFNNTIDMVIIIYPNKIEKDNLDKSFIKTYKKISKKNTIFIAGVEDSYYLKNSKVFNKVINTPLTILDIIELFSSPKIEKVSYNYLIIDDEPMNRMVLSSMIRTFDENGKIDTAIDGISGLEKIKSNKYDFIFLDKRMPKMDGYEVLEKIRELGLNIKNIYLLTADGDNETISKAKEYKVGYIAKPVTLQTLKSIVYKG